MHTVERATCAFLAYVVILLRARSVCEAVVRVRNALVSGYGTEVGVRQRAAVVPLGDPDT